MRRSACTPLPLPRRVTCSRQPRARDASDRRLTCHAQPNESQGSQSQRDARDTHERSRPHSLALARGRIGAIARQSSATRRPPGASEGNTGETRRHERPARTTTARSRPVRCPGPRTRHAPSSSCVGVWAPAKPDPCPSPSRARTGPPAATASSVARSPVPLVRLSVFDTTAPASVCTVACRPPSCSCSARYGYGGTGIDSDIPARAVLSLFCLSLARAVERGSAAQRARTRQRQLLSLSVYSLLGVQFNALLRNGAEQRPPSFSTIGLSSATQFNACPLLKKRLLLSSLTAPCHHSYSYVLAHAGFNTSAGLCVRRLVTQAARRGEEKREGIELIDGVAPLS